MNEKLLFELVEELGIDVKRDPEVDISFFLNKAASGHCNTAVDAVKLSRFPIGNDSFRGGNLDAGIDV